MRPSSSYNNLASSVCIAIAIVTAASADATKTKGLSFIIAFNAACAFASAYVRIVESDNTAFLEIKDAI